IVQEGEDAQRAIGGDHVEVRNAAPKQRVSLPEIVANVQTGHHPAETLARFVHEEELGNGIDQGLCAVVRAAEERDLRHRVTQYAGSDRVPLGMVSIQEAFWRRPLDHLGQLPSQFNATFTTVVKTFSATG